MTVDEFHELQAYYSEWPHWTERVQIYLAQVAWWVYITGVEKPKYKLDDFVFDFEEQQEPGSNRQSSKQIERNLKLAAEAFNGEYQQNLNVDNG